ncbi:MAG: translocation/assembly module TamB domain-containing protein [Saprospiraceae bacterium]|nr:translocation/assembly module TamB domain-containing protein [Saprospiraceae bacterium]
MGKLTTYLSTKMEADVGLKNVNFSIFKGVSMDNFYIGEVEGDTIFFAESLDVSLSRNLFSLWNNTINVKSVSLVSPRIYLDVDESDGKINLLKLLEKLGSGKNDGSGSPLVFNLREFYIEKLNFSMMDENRQVSYLARLKQGKINFEKFDLKNNTFLIAEVNFIQPEFQMLNFTTEQEVEMKEAYDTSGSNPLCLSVRKFSVLDGLLNLDHRMFSTNKELYTFDPNHIAYNHINIDISNLWFGGLDDIYAEVKNVSMDSPSGFSLKHLEIPIFVMNNEMLSMEKFNIRTADSDFGQSIVLKYNGIESFSDFENKVFIDAVFNHGVIGLKELGYFIPAFTKTVAYKKYQNRDLRLDGTFKGRVNNLRGSGLNVRLEDQLTFVGDFGVRNITRPDEALVNLRVRQLKTNIEFIRDIIPGFNPPATFYKLANIDFTGNFDGYLNDFVAFGTLKSDVGMADLDLRLDVKNGNEKAKYSGNLILKDFNIGTWSENANLGLVSLNARIRDGESLVFRNAKADLDGAINLLQFKGYDYTNIKINGKISPSEFIGSLISSDPNIDLTFDGSVIFSGEQPKYNFSSRIDNLNLLKLNLSKDIKAFSGDIVFQGVGNNINNLIGKLNGQDFLIVKNDSTYSIKSIDLSSTYIDNEGNKKLQLKTEMADIFIEGKYNLLTIVNDLKQMVKANFPYHVRNWNPGNIEVSNDQVFKFDIELARAVDLLRLAGLDSVAITSFKGKGNVDSKNMEFNIVSSLPTLWLKDLGFFNLQVLFNNKARSGDLLIHLDSAFVSGRKLNAVDMQYIMKGDEINFDINASSIIDSVQNFQFRGLVVPHPKGYTISILNNDIKLFGKRWKVSNESKVSIGERFIDIENLLITDGNRQIDLVDINNKGISIKATKIDLASINPLIHYDKILLGGELNSTLRVDDIFSSSPSLSGNLNIPAFTLNNDDYGELSIDISKAENKPIEALLSLSKPADGLALKLSGNYNLETKDVTAEVKGRKVSLKFLEYILKAGISNVKGYANVDAKISGKSNAIIIDGDATAYKGEVKINYLGETYYFDDQSFKITHKTIDLTGARLTDSEGSPGIITGRLNHTIFKDFYLDVSIYAQNVIAINTSKFDNPIYYGIGRGEVNVDFSGSVNTPKMIINAVTKPGTRINMPIKETRSTADRSFITFIDKEGFYRATKDSTNVADDVKLEGISIDMNLTMTEEAVVNMIFDEFKNDIITGVGKGNLRISMSNRGEFDMFGTYTITSGEYLFTALNIVNKPFKVREGGTIRWTGDPVNASLNIEADYSVRTPLTSFLTEYLVTDQLKNAAAVSTPVNLKLILGNTLFSPTVKFDFEFPALTGELKSYTDSKIRLLRNNEADYNSQVFGLIVFNSFIPSNAISDVVTNNNFIQSAGISTLSEFVSSQLSMFVTGIVNEALEDNGLISGIDFDIDLRNNTSFQSVTGNSSLLPTEIEVRLKNRFRFLDERLSINVGGNYVRQNSLINLNNYIVPEFFIEYALTKDRQLNLKLYGKYDLDEISLSNRRQKFGLGLRFKNEFGSMVETKTKLSDGFKKLLEDQKK